MIRTIPKIRPKIRSFRSTLAVLLAPLLLAAAPAALPAGARPFDAEALVDMARVSDPRVSADGEWVAYVLRETDRDPDRGRTDLWRVPAAGGESLRLTTGEASDSSPRWAPDGSLYFLSSRSGSSQVWKIPSAVGEPGEPVQVTDLPVDVGLFVLSPDASRLAVALEVFPDCDTVRCTADRLEAEEASPANGRIYDQLFVRHWDTWKDGRRSQLFTVVLNREGGEAAEPVRVSRGIDGDVPSKPFGGAEEIAWTPDGTGLVFTAREGSPEEPWSTDFDLYFVQADGSYVQADGSTPADGSADALVLTGDNPAWDTQPVFSPDGSTLAWLAMERAGFEADRLRIVLLPWGEDGPAGEHRVLTEAWDRSPGGIVWSPDGGTLYATAGDVGDVALFAVDTESGSVRRLVGDGHVRSPGVQLAGPAGEGGHRIVFGRDTMASPVDLFSVDASGSDLRRLTEANRAALADLSFGAYERFSFPGWNGETVHGWVVRPVGAREGERYPVAFLIHGGPQGSFGDDFHYRWNPQVYAGAGYAVVTVDFHGSTGYGQAFTDSITGDWGGKPLEDLRKGLAAALERFGFLDGERVCALGASYGGYMVNWIAGRWPDRFACLVNHDGIFDLRSMYYTTEELWFPEWELGGPYWENPEGYEVPNPVAHVEEWRAPMLVIHGGLDFRVPETQGLAAFTALQRRGIPSRLLYFPEENHWVLSPANSLLWHETVLDWLERWIGE
jgi:dipeptidyl aminopeptidase/acylaminoacyl peptidase